MPCSPPSNKIGHFLYRLREAKLHQSYTVGGSQAIEGRFLFLIVSFIPSPKKENLKIEKVENCLFQQLIVYL